MARFRPNIAPPPVDEGTRMRRGPIPSDPSVVRLRGNPAKRRIAPVLEVPARSEVPEPPDFLCPYGREEWVRLASELCALGVLTELDLTCFAAYTETYARWRWAVEALQASGGANPALARAARIASSDLLRHGAEFGLSPVSRLRLRIGIADPPSKFSALIS